MNGEFHPLERYIVEVSEHIFVSFLGLIPETSTCEKLNENSTALRLGYVNIRGSWDGAVLIRCSNKLASNVAKKMFSNQIDPDDTDIVDALAELANIIGGNIKTMISEYQGGKPCSLSTPTTLDKGSEEKCFENRSYVCKCNFRIEEELLQVILLKNN